jgi:hypothetical protein
MESPGVTATRNARPSRLRVLVPACNAIVKIDLADIKQMVSARCRSDRFRREAER